MNKYLAAVAVIALLTMGGFLLWRQEFTGTNALDRETRNHACNYLDTSQCNVSCKTDNDCKAAYGSCVNAGETVYAPQGLSVASYTVVCSCKISRCVGTPTGEIAI